MLKDSLEDLANDDDEVLQNHDIVGSNSCSNMSSFSSSNFHVRVDMEDVVDEDNIKLPYPEDAVDDEGQLVDEHDDHHHHHRDDLVVSTTLKNETSVWTTPTAKTSTDATSTAVKNSMTVTSSPKQRRKRDITTMRKAPLHVQTNGN
jgi:hypothetical protein